METNQTIIEERQEKDKQALVEALKEMPIARVACKRAGVSRATYYRWRNEDKKFLQECHRAISIGIEAINEMSDSQLIALIGEKSLQAIKWWQQHNHERYGAKARPNPAAEINDTTSIDTANFSIHTWIRKYRIKNEKGDPIEFKNHLFLYDIYRDQSPE